MANGRCYRHGGKTPSGDNWHKTQWPNADAPDADRKLARKLDNQARAAKKRAKRLASMSSEEQEQHQAWQRDHRPGPVSARAAARTRRKQALEAAALIRAVSVPDPEIENIQRRIDELEARRAAETATIFD